jgi:hypothetical protein
LVPVVGGFEGFVGDVALVPVVGGFEGFVGDVALVLG